MEKKFLNKIMLLILFFITDINQLFANEDCPTCPAGMPNPSGTNDEAPGTPIDNALFWLLIAGIMMGFYLLQKQKQAKTET
ncbi:MAG: hypothetical protein WCY89_11660 [Flavobacteriaceae bacterium]